jgi:hypothetical protein
MRGAVQGGARRLAAAGLALVAAGCGSGASSPAATLPEPPAPPAAAPADLEIVPIPVPPPRRDEPSFLAAVRAAVPAEAAVDVPDAGLLAFGEYLCILARRGTPLQDPSPQARDLGVPADLAPAVAEAAREHLCGL